MKGDWGNILPFILMALFAIFGAINKKKKPVNKLQGDEAERSEDEMPASIENIFDSLLGADAFETQESHPYQGIQDEIVEDEIEDFPKEEIKVESVSGGTPLIMEVEDLENAGEGLEVNQEFDWKQAIISKEILDRKYI